jgi:hypothetical protein
MQVTVTINPVQKKFPGGTVGGNWHIEVALASAPATIVDQYEGPNSSANFDLTEAATYIGRGYRLDAAGATLGPIVTDQFVVGADLVSLDVAATMTVTSAPTRRAP